MILLLLALFPDTGLPPRGLDPGSLGLDRVLAPLAGAHGGLAFSPDGSRLALGTAQGLRLFETRRWEPAGRLDGPDSILLSVAWSPDGTQVAAGASDGTVIVWPASGGHACHLFTGHEGQVASLAWSRDGAMLVSGSLDGTARVWDLAAGVGRRTLGGGDPSVMALEVLDEAGRVRAVAGNGTIRVWDLGTGRECETISGAHGLLTAAVLSRDGRLATGNGAGDVWVRSLAAGGVDLALPPPEEGSSIGRLAFTPGGRFLLGATHAGELRAWDVRSGGLLASIASGAAGMEAIAVDPAGRCIATAGQDRLLRIWRSLPGSGPRARPRGLCGIQVEDGPAGPVVVSVMEGKPAAGRLQVGDRIRSVDGVAARERADVVDLIGRRFAGDEVVLALDRAGSEVEVRVTLLGRDDE